MPTEELTQAELDFIADEVRPSDPHRRQHLRLSRPGTARGIDQCPLVEEMSPEGDSRQFEQSLLPLLLLLLQPVADQLLRELPEPMAEIEQRGAERAAELSDSKPPEPKSWTPALLLTPIIVPRSRGSLWTNLQSPGGAASLCPAHGGLHQQHGDGRDSAGQNDPTDR